MEKKLADQLPGLDCTSTGPKAYHVYTSSERVGIVPMGRFGDYLWYF